jgi:hypothetical protein
MTSKEEMAQGELAGIPEYAGLSEHALFCSAPWCVEYIQVFARERAALEAAKQRAKNAFAESKEISETP